MVGTKFDLAEFCLYSLIPVAAHDGICIIGSSESFRIRGVYVPVLLGGILSFRGAVLLDKVACEENDQDDKHEGASDDTKDCSTTETIRVIFVVTTVIDLVEDRHRACCRRRGNVKHELAVGVIEHDVEVTQECDSKAHVCIKRLGNANTAKVDISSNYWVCVRLGGKRIVHVA